MKLIERFVAIFVATLSLAAPEPEVQKRRVTRSQLRPHPHHTPLSD